MQCKIPLVEFSISLVNCFNVVRDIQTFSLRFRNEKKMIIVEFSFLRLTKPRGDSRLSDFKSRFSPIFFRWFFVYLCRFFRADKKRKILFNGENESSTGKKMRNNFQLSNKMKRIFKVFISVPLPKRRQIIFFPFSINAIVQSRNRREVGVNNFHESSAHSTHSHSSLLDQLRLNNLQTQSSTSSSSLFFPSPRRTRVGWNGRKTRFFTLSTTFFHSWEQMGIGRAKRMKKKWEELRKLISENLEFPTTTSHWSKES